MFGYEIGSAQSKSNNIRKTEWFDCNKPLLVYYNQINIDGNFGEEKHNTLIYFRNLDQTGFFFVS